MMRAIASVLLLGGSTVMAQTWNPTSVVTPTPTSTTAAPTPSTGPLTVQLCGWSCCTSGSNNQYINVMPDGVDEACVEWGTASKFQVHCDQQGFYTAWVWEGGNPKQCNTNSSVIVGSGVGRGDGSCQNITWGFNSNNTQTNYFNVLCPIQPSATTPYPSTTPTEQVTTTVEPTTQAPIAATPTPTPAANPTPSPTSSPQSMLCYRALVGSSSSSDQLSSSLSTWGNGFLTSLEIPYPQYVTFIVSNDTSSLVGCSGSYSSAATVLVTLPVTWAQWWAVLQARINTTLTQVSTIQCVQRITTLGMPACVLTPPTAGAPTTIPTPTPTPNTTWAPTLTPTQRPFSSTGGNNGYDNSSGTNTGSWYNSTSTYWSWDTSIANYSTCSASCWDGSYTNSSYYGYSVPKYPTCHIIPSCYRHTTWNYPYYPYTYAQRVDDSECLNANVTRPDYSNYYNDYYNYNYYFEPCNTQRCAPQGATFTWVNGTIGPCSAPPPCHVAGTANPTAYRNVSCQQTLNGFTTTVNDNFCYYYTNTSRPSNYVECNTALCHNYQWIITPTSSNYLDDGWTGCTAACDGGIQTRQVKCRDLSLSVNPYYYYPLYDDRDVVPDSFCSVRGPKPITQRTCNTQACNDMSFALGDPCYYYNGESLCISSPNGTTTSAIAVCQYQSYPIYRYTWQLQSYCFGPNSQCDNVGLHGVCVASSSQPTNPPTTVVPTMTPTANPTATPTANPTSAPSNGGDVMIGASVMLLSFNINFTFPFPQYKSTDKFSVQQIDAAMRYIASQANIADANVVMDDAQIRRVTGLVDGRTGQWQVSIGFKGTDQDQVTQTILFLKQLRDYQTPTATATVGVSTGSAEVSVTPSSAASGVSFDPNSNVDQNQQRVLFQTCPDGIVIDASATCSSLVLTNPSGSSKSVPLTAIVVPVVVGVMLLIGVAVAATVIHRRRSAAKLAGASAGSSTPVTAAPTDAAAPVPATSVVVV